MDYFKVKRKGQTLTAYYMFGRVPNYTQKLLHEIVAWQNSFIENDFTYKGSSFERMIVYSMFPRFFNLGGDLNFFVQQVEQKDRKALLDYAYLCLDAMCNQRLISQHLITVSYLEGAALGGGLEGALSGQYVIAKNENLKVGFPEAKFGLFPGMGGHAICYELFNDWDKVEEFVTNGKVYTAKEAVEIGLIDGIGKVPEKLPFKKKPIFDRDFLNQKTEEWVDRALSLNNRNILRMHKLSSMQKSGKLQFLARVVKPLNTYKLWLNQNTTLHRVGL